jgi:hypothetical protein
LLAYAKAGAQARITQLREELAALQAAFGSVTVKAAAKGRRKRSKLSAAGRANIVAAQKARWAAKKSAEAKPKAKRRKMSKAGRAKIAAAAKARWAKWRAEKKK